MEPEPAPERTRSYYSIREVSDMLGVKAHVLRYWETQFRGLRPKKGRSGARMYQEKDLDTLRAIQELLYERRYTIEGARKKLELEGKEPPAAEEEQTEIEFLAPAYRKRLRALRNEILSIRSWLQTNMGE